MEFLRSVDLNEVDNLTEDEALAIRFLTTFARKFSNIDFFLKISPWKDDELVMSEM